MQLPGGHGVFGNLTVEQNLAVSARLNARAARRGRRARSPSVFDLFPELAERRKQIATSMSGGQQQMLALAPRADPRTRAADDRRALARARAGGRAAAARGGRGAQGARPDDDHRRAVAQRRARDRRPGDLPREGRGAVRGRRARACSNAATWPGRCSSGPRAADDARARSSPGTWSSRASSAG